MENRLKGNAPDKYDLIREYLLHGTELKDAKHRELAEAARQIYPILVDELATKGVVAKMEELGICGPRKAYALIRETERIYGRIRFNSKDGLRSILVESLLQSIKDAHTNKDYNAVARLTDKVAKLESLYKEENQVQELYKALVLMPIRVTSDPMTVQLQDVTVEVETP